MTGARAARLVKAVLRCYPVRWRGRHGAEAAELAAQLIRDGTPVGSVVLSYLLGAARERLTPRPGRHLGTVMCALLVVACSLGISAGVLTSTVPARAASTSRAGGGAHCAHRPAAAVQHELPARHHREAASREAADGADGRSC